jgi:hypothetical protein
VIHEDPGIGLGAQVVDEVHRGQSMPLDYDMREWRMKLVAFTALFMSLMLKIDSSMGGRSWSTSCRASQLKCECNRERLPVLLANPRMVACLGIRGWPCVTGIAVEYAHGTSRRRHYAGTGHYCNALQPILFARDAHWTETVSTVELIRYAERNRH